MIDLHRQLQGRQSHAAGQHFEQFIESACAWYRERGIAYIEKTPEPMKVLKPAPNMPGQFIACFEKSAQPDYKGTVTGGRAVVFEAKHTDGDKIEGKRVTEEQGHSLDMHQQLGAVCFVLVSIRRQYFYRVPWPVWKTMKDRFGHQHMTVMELNPYLLRFTGPIKFLFENDIGKECGTDANL